LGRTQYGLHQDAVNLGKTLDEEKWKKAIFWVFDIPEILKPYEVFFILKFVHCKERVEYLKEFKLPEFVKIVDVIECNGYV
jgi:phenolic acid decarboxylase